VPTWRDSQHLAQPYWPGAARSCGHFTRYAALVGAALAEQNDESTEARRYRGLDLLAKAASTRSSQKLTRPRRTKRDRRGAVNAPLQRT
jgi:hypothetical protein